MSDITTTEVPKPEAPKTRTSRKGALLPGVPRTGTPKYGLREPKYVRPICDTCVPNSKYAPPRWWESCPHEPYIGWRSYTETKRTYEDEIVDGKPTGRRFVSGSEEKTFEGPFPNVVGVTVNIRVNSGNGEARARAKGWIPVTELRTEAYPNGLAPICEGHNCFLQEGITQYKTGLFHSIEEAAEVYGDAMEETRWLGGTGDSPVLVSKGNRRRAKQSDEFAQAVTI